MQDALLVKRCRQGDREALRRIYEKYRDDLLILAIALSHDVNVAEDAVHDTFVKFAGSFGDFKLTGSLKAYLARCVVNRVRDLIRTAQRHVCRLEQQGWSPAGPDDPSQAVICNEQLQQLSSALAKLPHDQREAVVLRTYGRMRFKAIAKSLGVSVDAAKGRYRSGVH
jgi:RNA polymerase sigma-70 factor (ECF subfamily)